MAVFKDTIVTDKGQEVLARALATNKRITFTRVITSNKVYADNVNINELLTIENIKQSVNISDVSQNERKVKIKAVFTNADVTAEYKIETIGLFAKIDNENEILYSVTRAKVSDTMPPNNGINLSTVEIDIITEINNSDGARFEYTPSSLVTLSMLRDNKEYNERIFVKKTDISTDTVAGIVTLNKIREVAPTPPRSTDTVAGIISKNEVRQLVPTATDTVAGVVTLNKIREVAPTPPIATDTEAGVVTLNKIREVAPTPPRAGDEVFGVISKNEVRTLTATEELNGTVSLNDIKRVIGDNQRKIVSGAYTVTATPQNINLAEYGFKENGNFTIIPFFKNLPTNKNIRMEKIENTADNRIIYFNVLDQRYVGGTLQTENMGVSVTSLWSYSDVNYKVEGSRNIILSLPDAINYSLDTSPWKHKFTINGATYFEFLYGGLITGFSDARAYTKFVRETVSVSYSGRHGSFEHKKYYYDRVATKQTFSVCSRWKEVGTEVWSEWEMTRSKNFSNEEGVVIKKYDVEIMLYISKREHFIGGSSSQTEPKYVADLNVTIKKNTTSSVAETPILGAELNWIAYEN